jgi:phosphatidylglycerophosphatase A
VLTALPSCRHGLVLTIFPWTDGEAFSCPDSRLPQCQKPLYILCASQLNDIALLGVVAALFALGVWACGRTGTDMGISDHSGMVWDEVVAMMLILIVIPSGLGWWVAAFFIFRFFDIVKPPPIRYFDQTIKGGLGVMFDDIAAAFYTLLVLAVAERILG